MSKVRVVCVAPGNTVRGGISRLIQKIDKAFPASIDFQVIPSCSNYIGDGQPLGWNSVKQIAYFVLCLLRVLHRAAFTRSTIFHLHFSHRGSALRKGVVCIMLRCLKSRYIIHGHAYEDAIVHPWLPSVVRKALFWGFRGAQRLIALTPFWRQYYIEKGVVAPDRALVIPNPAQIPDSVPSREEGDHLELLSLGRVGTRKGTFDLISAFGALPPLVRSRCHLTIAGDGDVEQARSLLSDLGCTNSTSVLGWIGGDRVDQLLAQADVLLLPSRAEGMSMALLEGMAWGLAVVTTSASGASEFLLDDRNCILVEAGDVQGIAIAIERLAQDRNLRQDLGREARNTAKRFGVDQYVKRLADLYQELAGAAISTAPTGIDRVCVKSS
jgi:glycosyltransferase involved in cell wall biosynthesis